MQTYYQKTSDVPTMLENSSNFLIIRLDDDGLHCHCKDEGDLGLIAFFLSNNDELYKATVKEVNRYKKLKK